MGANFETEVLSPPTTPPPPVAHMGYDNMCSGQWTKCVLIPY